MIIILMKIIQFYNIILKYKDLLIKIELMSTVEQKVMPTITVNCKSIIITSKAPR
jgi:hypothetical protein